MPQTHPLACPCAPHLLHNHVHRLGLHHGRVRLWVVHQHAQHVQALQLLAALSAAAVKQPAQSEAQVRAHEGLHAGRVCGGAAGEVSGLRGLAGWC